MAALFFLAHSQNFCTFPNRRKSAVIRSGELIVQPDAAAIPLLLIATIIANHVSVAAVWIITTLLTVIGCALQIVGHQFFEQRRPALLDNPIHMLISYQIEF